MFPFLKAKRPSGKLGLEIRPDGLALACWRDNGLEYEFVPCNAAERDLKLKELVAEKGMDGMDCRAVLPFDQYKTYPIEKPDVEDQELADAVRWRVKDMLEFDLEDAVTDVYEFPSDALRGRPAQVNVVVARKTIVQTLVDLVASAGLTLQSIDVADLAMRNIIGRQEGDADRARAMLYLRRGAGIMTFVKGDALYLARHFEFSLEALNEPSQQDSVIQFLALEIQRSFDYFESQLGQVPPQELILFGPDPNIPLANMLGGSITAKVAQLDLSTLEMTDGLDAINSLVATGAVMREELN